MIDIKNLFFVFIFSTLFSCNMQPENDVLFVEGVSAELAAFRKKQVYDVVYHLSFHIPLKKEEPIASKLELNVNLSNNKNHLILDFNEDKSHIKHVQANGDSIPINQQKEHLIVDKKYLKEGENTVSVLFDAGEKSLNRNEDYLYTLLVPDRASTLFPCFDQPDIKAKYMLDITAPKSWKVVSGAPLTQKEELGDFTRHVYGVSDKMSTYLFSFVAGEFQKVTKKPKSMEMNLLFRENDQAKIDSSIDEIFKLHQESVDFLEDYTKYTFPFQKLDFVAIPGFQYGGMEHVGAIQYREPSLFLDESATQESLLNRAKLIAHETSHMWYGDLVTMKWFNDVWLKEVFANFMADKIVNSSFPEINHNLNFLTTHYPSAYSEDRTRGATPIKQKLDNLKNAGTLYGNIIYHKAPIMMRQLEAIMGEEPLKKGMQKYIETYANGNADWNDLVDLLNNETPIDLKQWSEVWVNQPGRPIISDHVTFENGKITNFEIFQNAEDGSDRLWAQAFSLGFVYPDSVHTVYVKIKDKKTILDKVVGMTKPEAIIYNYNGLGYGVFPLDISNSSISSIKDDVARGYAYINLYENVLNGNVAPIPALNEFIKGFKVENEDLIVNLISGKIGGIFWKNLSNEQREKMQQPLERILKERLSENLSPSIKKTVFYLYQSIAYSETGKDFLYDIWNKTTTIDSLKLNENDYTGLAGTLAIYKHEKAAGILSKAKEDITNADRKKRFEFLFPSLSNDESVRDDFVKSLSKPENREKESWVLSALRYINHPLRQDSAKKHLRFYLDLVEEIQLTGDIFFPKGWLDVTIGYYTSEEAYRVLQEFLNDNPDFSPVLKNKLLQSTDGLYRVQELWKM